MKVLAGLLDTPEGRAALDRAAEEARSEDGELHIVAYVARPSSDEDASDFLSERTQKQHELDAKVEEMRRGGVRCTGHLPVGHANPADAILQIALQEHVELIVIGLRNRSRVGKLVLGSNAMDILRGAECSVLAVKTGSE